VRPLALTTALLTLAAAACSEDGAGDGGDPCGRAEAVRAEATATYCEGKTSACCFCRCWEDFGGDYDTLDLLDNAACTCVTPPGSAQECSGQVRDSAEVCLDDEDSCAAVATDVAESLCLGSAL
jgi:hypothetical protein